MATRFEKELKYRETAPNRRLWIQGTLVLVIVFHFLAICWFVIPPEIVHRGMQANASPGWFLSSERSWVQKRLQLERKWYTQIFEWYTNFTSTRQTWMMFAPGPGAAAWIQVHLVREWQNNGSGLVPIYDPVPLFATNEKNLDQQINSVRNYFTIESIWGLAFNQLSVANRQKLAKSLASYWAREYVRRRGVYPPAIEVVIYRVKVRGLKEFQKGRSLTLKPSEISKEILWTEKYDHPSS